MAILEAITKAKGHGQGKPSMIILDTVKGRGVSFIEQAGVNNHNMPITPEQVQMALAELS